MNSYELIWHLVDMLLQNKEEKSNPDNQKEDK